VTNCGTRFALTGCETLLGPRDQGRSRMAQSAAKGVTLK